MVRVAGWQDGARPNGRDTRESMRLISAARFERLKCLLLAVLAPGGPGMARTIHGAPGIDPAGEILTPEARPVTILAEGARFRKLFG